MRLKRQTAPGQKLAKKLTKYQIYQIYSVAGLGLIFTGLWFFSLLLKILIKGTDTITATMLYLVIFGLVGTGLYVYGKALLIKFKIQQTDLRKLKSKEWKKNRLRKSKDKMHEKGSSN